jgi:hypothetical protein
MTHDGYPKPAAVGASSDELAQSHALWRGWALTESGEGVCPDCLRALAVEGGKA